MMAVDVSLVGDACLSVAFPGRIDPAINAECVALADALRQEQRIGVRDIVPGFHTVAVHFDPSQVDRLVLAVEVQRTAMKGVAAIEPEVPPLEIPVQYGGEYGPDLADVAAFAGCSEADAVELHSARVYRVYMLGFLPGFAYLGLVDSRIAMPRLDTPRFKVAAGSVGIAGAQTGIYPCDTPGGWRIIGRATIDTFDVTRATPSLLRPGQRVKFIAA